jgi:hypothetical protein
MFTAPLKKQKKKTEEEKKPAQWRCQPASLGCRG